MTITGGKLITYGEIYRANRETDTTLINYHAFGLAISTAIVYIAQSNGWLKKLSFIGVAFMLTGILAIFVTESRANLLITLLVLLMLYIANNRLKVIVAFRLGILLALVGYLASFAMKSNERLNRRYDVQNTEYIQQTTDSRFVFIALTFKELLELPFGGGVKNNRVDFFGTEFQPHNQYLTFILFAGIFGLAADIIWFFIFSRTLIKVAKINLNHYKPHLAALTVTMLVMFTNDLSGAFFLLMLTFQTWLAKEVLSRRKVLPQ
jgi:O-antigen ligase